MQCFVSIFIALSEICGYFYFYQITSFLPEIFTLKLFFCQFLFFSLLVLHLFVPRTQIHSHICCFAQKFYIYPWAVKCCLLNLYESFKWHSIRFEKNSPEKWAMTSHVTRRVISKMQRKSVNKYWRLKYK